MSASHKTEITYTGSVEFNFKIMEIFCENFCKVLPCFDIVFNLGKADNICKIQGVLKITELFVLHTYPFGSEWQSAALVFFLAASPTATNQVCGVCRSEGQEVVASDPTP